MREVSCPDAKSSAALRDSHEICAETIGHENGNTRRAGDERALSLLDYPGASASGALCFTGTARDHLARVERAIERQRKAHGPVSELLKRQRVLKARCAALGASS
jgi:hypothetical protein